MIKGYKAFDKGLKCKGYQFEVGKEHKIDSEIKKCNKGFHYCENPFDVLDYYEFYDYNNTIDGTIISDFIDYANSNCTYLQTVTSYGEIMDKDGVADNMLQHNLYTNCGLISGLEYVD